MRLKRAEDSGIRAAVRFTRRSFGCGRISMKRCMASCGCTIAGSGRAGRLSRRHFAGRRIVDAYPNRIINIHPALIPSFCGTGYYGLEAYMRRRLARGVKCDRGDGAFCGWRHGYRTDHFAEGGGGKGERYAERCLQQTCDGGSRMGDSPEGDRPDRQRQR